MRQTGKGVFFLFGFLFRLRITLGNKQEIVRYSSNKQNHNKEKNCTLQFIRITRFCYFLCFLQLLIRLLEITHIPPKLLLQRVQFIVALLHLIVDAYSNLVDLLGIVFYLFYTLVSLLDELCLIVNLHHSYLLLLGLILSIRVSCRH
jgi:hypothetical protein